MGNFPYHDNLSIDEMIVGYYGPSSLKQFIKGKPRRFGDKFWAMCGENAYCYNFSLCCGKYSREVSNTPPGNKVVSSRRKLIIFAVSRHIKKKLY